MAYYWSVRKNANGSPRIRIMSEDKSLQLTCGFDREIGIGTHHIKKLLIRYLEEKKG